MKTIVLIGDSIRMAYQPLVAEKLADRCTVWGPAENCRHSLWALDHFAQWVEPRKPDLVHCNFGIHDVALQKDGRNQIVLEQYRLCLERFIGKVEALGARMIWATTTPLFVAGPEKPQSDWPRRPEPVEAYNAAALRIVRRHKIPVNDLHKVILQQPLRCLSRDGCHMEPFGNEALAEAVARCIEKHLD